MKKHFFDIGANVGQTFDWLATQPHDYADHVFWLFEPSPRHLAALGDKATAMAAKYTDIRLCPFGLDGRTTTKTFFEKDDPKGDSFDAWTASDHETKNISRGFTLICQTVSIVEFIIENTAEDDKIVLDIDAEGAEYSMLIRLLTEPKALSRVKRIMAEFHFIAGIDCASLKKTVLDSYAFHGITIEVRGSVP
jgi:FkbM family methyltransferase